jgi:hypothetical protein
MRDCLELKRNPKQTNKQNDLIYPSSGSCTPFAQKEKKMLGEYVVRVVGVWFEKKKKEARKNKTKIESWRLCKRGREKRYE